LWPFATRSICEQAIKLLVKDELVKKLSPLEKWRVRPSTEARDKGSQHERRLCVKNDINAWHIAKIHQHAKHPSKTAERSVFEEGFVSSVNDAFT
jgi:hypothetical protein